MYGKSPICIICHSWLVLLGIFWCSLKYSFAAVGRQRVEMCIHPRMWQKLVWCLMVFWLRKLYNCGKACGLSNTFLHHFTYFHSLTEAFCSSTCLACWMPTNYYKTFLLRTQWSTSQASTTSCWIYIHVSSLWLKWCRKGEWLKEFHMAQQCLA